MVKSLVKNSEMIGRGLADSDSDRARFFARSKRSNQMVKSKSVSRPGMLAVSLAENPALPSYFQARGWGENRFESTMLLVTSKRHAGVGEVYYTLTRAETHTRRERERMREEERERMRERELVRE